jgi:hypothetical protein
LLTEFGVWHTIREFYHEVEEVKEVEGRGKKRQAPFFSIKKYPEI